MSAKHALRNSAARLLLTARLTAPERCARTRFSIVTFHRVLPDAERRAYPYPGLVVTPEELESFLTYFVAHFDCGPLSIQHERYVRDTESPTRPLLAITFDDGQHDNYWYARAVLDRHGIKASFFVPVLAIERQELLWHDRLGFAVLALRAEGEGAEQELSRIVARAGLTLAGTGGLAEKVARECKRLPPDIRARLIHELETAAGSSRTAPEFARMMNFEEVAELGADGHEIGSHSMTHRMIPECSDEDLAYELRESRRVLERQLSQPVRSFCYPNGDVDARVANAVAASGYQRAVTTRWGNNGSTTAPFMLRRYDMDSRYVKDSRDRILAAAVALRMSPLYSRLRSERLFKVR